MSVVIPTYNRAGLVSEAVESALAQTLAANGAGDGDGDGDGGVEVVVVDDGSTDDTEARLAPLAAGGRIVYVRQSNQGPAVARNRGVAVARGEWVAFLDSDDLWEPAKLETQLRFAARNPRVALVCSSYMKVEGGRRFERQRHGRTGRVFLDLFLGNWVRTSTVLLRRDVFGAVGGFRPRFAPCEDYDLWLRVAHDHEVGYDPTPLATYRYQPDGISRAALKARELFLEILEANDDPALVPRRLYRRRLAYVLTHIAKHHLARGDRAAAHACFRRAAGLDRLSVSALAGFVRTAF